jgi:hypothetical protein
MAHPPEQSVPAGIDMIDQVLKRIKKESIGSGQFYVHALRDLPDRPLMGGGYIAARVFDEHTANVLVEALKVEAIRVLGPPIQPACRLPSVPLDKPQKVKSKTKSKTKSKAKK